MTGFRQQRNIWRFFVLVSAILVLFAATGGVSAEKDQPLDPALRIKVIGEVPEKIGNEVWVDAPAVDRDNMPRIDFEGFAPSLLAPSTSIVINEFDQVNDNVEIFNLSGSAVEMSGWQLKIYVGTNTLINTYTFPTGFVLSSGAYVVLHDNGNPLDNTATDLYAGENLVIQSLGGAMSLTDDTTTGVDFVRWNVGLITPPTGTGWVGTNPYLPTEVQFSLGRNADSLDSDHGEDWVLQVSTFGMQNDPGAPLCVQLWLISSGNGGFPTYTPTQSTGCDTGYFIPGEVITVTATPDSEWEVGQWGEEPATEYLGTSTVINYTMTLEHEYLWLSYIQSNPAAETVLLVGLWGDYSFTLEDLDVAYDAVAGSRFAPGWEVLHRYDMVIYQSLLGEPFYINMRSSNYATYLDEGGCMWVEADSYDEDPEEFAPNVPYYYFGINGFETSFVADTILGAGTLYTGLGPYDDPFDEYYPTLTPYSGAETAFENNTGGDIGVTKINPNYTTAFVTFDFNNLAQLEQAEILATFLDACGITHTGFEPPTNDDFDFPIVISALSYTNTQGALSIMQATTAGDDPDILSGQRYRTVWYSYTPSETESLKIDTFGSDYDTILGVWTGTRGSLTNVVVNDDSNSTLQSEVEFSAIGGTPYFIEVASYSTDYGKLVLNLELNVEGPGDLLFESDFEEGNLLEWTRYNDGGGWLYVCSQGAINGSWGACIERGDNDRRKQLIDETPVNQTTFNARLNFDINSLSMGSGERFRFLQTKMEAVRPFYIVLKYNAGKYEFQYAVRLDSAVYAKTGWYLLSNAPHTIEVDWAASSGPGANDGTASLYLDDVLLETLSGLDNDTFFVENFKVGFTSRLEGKVISGIFYVDDVATSNTGYIGLP